MHKKWQPPPARLTFLIALIALGLGLAGIAYVWMSDETFAIKVGGTVIIVVFDLILAVAGLRQP